MTDPEYKFETTADQVKAFNTYVRAKEWQEVFDNLTDHSEADNLRDQAIDELDAMFPYKGRSVYMGGYGLHLVKDEETKELNDEVWGYRVGVVGKHNGFNVIDNDEDGTTVSYHVMQQILLGHQGGPLQWTVHQQLLFYDYFDLDSNCLVIDEINGIFYEESEQLRLAEQMISVQKASQTLCSLLQSTAFRRMNHAKQRSRVSSLIAQAEQEAKIRGTELLAEAEYGYINDFNVNMHIQPVDVRNSVIGGVCLGLESLESLALRARAIRRDANLVDKTAGVCLVLDPNAETKQGLCLRPEQLLYIPFGQNLNLEKVSGVVVRPATD